MLTVIQKKVFVKTNHAKRSCFVLFFFRSIYLQVLKNNFSELETS